MQKDRDFLLFSTSALRGTIGALLAATILWIVIALLVRAIFL